MLRAPWEDQGPPATNVGWDLGSLHQPHAPREVQGGLRLLSYLRPPPTHPQSAFPQNFSSACCSMEKTVGHMDILVKYLESVDHTVKLMRILAFDTSKLDKHANRGERDSKFPVNPTALLPESPQPWGHLPLGCLDPLLSASASVTAFPQKVCVSSGAPVLPGWRPSPATVLTHCHPRRRHCSCAHHRLPPRGRLVITTSHPGPRASHGTAPRTGTCAHCASSLERLKAKVLVVFTMQVTPHVRANGTPTHRSFWGESG